MRRTDELITQVRQETENVGYGTDYGIPQSEFIQYLQDAQEQLQAAVLVANPRCSWFDKQVTYSITSLQKDYAIPAADAYYKNQVRCVEFSLDSQDNYYVPLPRMDFMHLQNYAVWPPNGYALYGGYIRLGPPPSSGIGSVRITYVSRLPKLGLPIGQATSLTGAALLLDSDTFLDATTCGTVPPGYLSLTSYSTGASVSLSVSVSAYTSGTRTFTASTPTYETGYTSANIATSLVTSGANSTCVSKLPDDCERYLIKYCAWKILKRDSSLEAADAGSELTQIEKAIVSAAEGAYTDNQVIPMEFY